MQTHDTDILQKHLIHSHLLNRSARKPNNQQPSIPRNALRALINHAHRIKHNIHTSSLGRNLLHQLRPRRIRVIDNMIRTERFRHIQFMFCASGSNDRRSKRLSYLHGRQSNTTSRRVNKHIIPLFNTSSCNQGAVTRRRGDEQACCFEETPPFRYGLEGLLERCDFRGVPALRGAEDAVADFVFGGAIGGGGGEDDACEFGAGDPGEGGLMLVFACDLEEVEEIGCGCVDAD